MTTETTQQLAPEHAPVRDAIPFGGVAAIIGALALAVGNSMISWVISRGDYTTTQDYLELVDAHRTLMLVGDGAALVAAVFLVPGIWAVTHRLRERTPVIAGIGGWLAASGYVAAMVLVVESQIGMAVIATGGDTSAYVEAIDERTTITMTLVYMVFGIGALLGPTILGIAMLRQRATYPVWAGIALLLSEPVRAAGLGLGIWVLPAVGSALMAAAFAVVMFRRPRQGNLLDRSSVL